ncbi:hypothetical protein [Bacillus wiedmannii]|uniref:hypothetical protein n=1 Tax=Bacillus wiedmannii TaxID=1890302 RepID=UPI000BF1704F|nr:hypothetical protein [Bacillus wiedmannii]PEL63773.1 hypothetical protein CN622_08825 [Bacillus wiedmannii]
MEYCFEEDKYVYSEKDVESMFEKQSKEARSIEEYLYILELESFFTFSTQALSLRKMVEEEIKRVVQLSDKEKYIQVFKENEQKEYEEIKGYVDNLFSSSRIFHSDEKEVTAENIVF